MKKMFIIIHNNAQNNILLAGHQIINLIIIN